MDTDMIYEQFDLDKTVSLEQHNYCVISLIVEDGSVTLGPENARAIAEKLLEFANQRIS